MKRYWTCPYCGHVTHGRYRVNAHLIICPIRMARGGPMKCPECGEVVQASRSDWFTFDPDYGTTTDSGELHVYCLNDHDLDSNAEIVAWVAGQLEAWDRHCPTCGAGPGACMHIRPTTVS